MQDIYDLLLPLSEVRGTELWPAHSTIYEQGMPANRVCLIGSGRVHLYRLASNGRILSFRSAGPREVIGLSAAILGQSELNAETTQPSQLRFVSPDVIRPSIAARHLAIELHNIYKLTTDSILAPSAMSKLADVILASPNGKLHLSHENISTHIGCSRETVTRCLTKLRSAGAIKTNPISIVNADILKKLIA